MTGKCSVYGEDEGNRGPPSLAKMPSPRVCTIRQLLVKAKAWSVHRRFWLRLACRFGKDYSGFQRLVKSPLFRCLVHAVAIARVLSLSPSLSLSRER